MSPRGTCVAFRLGMAQHKQRSRTSHFKQHRNSDVRSRVVETAPLAVIEAGTVETTTIGTAEAGTSETDTLDANVGIVSSPADGG